MLRADLQEERSAAQREGPSGEGAALVPLQDSDVVRDGDTYYLVINNNLGERCLPRGRLIPTGTHRQETQTASQISRETFSSAWAPSVLRLRWT